MAPARTSLTSLPIRTRASDMDCRSREGGAHRGQTLVASQLGRVAGREDDIGTALTRKLSKYRSHDTLGAHILGDFEWTQFIDPPPRYCIPRWTVRRLGPGSRKLRLHFRKRTASHGLRNIHQRPNVRLPQRSSIMGPASGSASRCKRPPWANFLRIWLAVRETCHAPPC